jgi:hypothetical protein
MRSTPLYFWVVRRIDSEASLTTPAAGRSSRWRAERAPPVCLPLRRRALHSGRSRFNRGYLKRGEPTEHVATAEPPEALEAVSAQPEAFGVVQAIDRLAAIAASALHELERALGAADPPVDWMRRRGGGLGAVVRAPPLVASAVAGPTAQRAAHGRPHRGADGGGPPGTGGEATRPALLPRSSAEEPLGRPEHLARKPTPRLEPVI